MAFSTSFVLFVENPVPGALLISAYLVPRKVRNHILAESLCVPAQGGGLINTLCIAVDDNAVMGRAGFLPACDFWLYGVLGKR